MQYGDFYYPMPVNEPVLNYAPGSKEKLALKKVLKKLKLELPALELLVAEFMKFYKIKKICSNCALIAILKL